MTTLTAGPGTISIASNSAAVVGTGTAFTNYRAGAILSIDGAVIGQFADDPADDTHATLVLPIGGTAITGAGYAIGTVSASAYQSERVRQLIETLAVTKPGIPLTMDATTTLGDPGAGKVRFNSATNPTIACISYTDNLGNSCKARVQALDDSVNAVARAVLEFTPTGDSSAYLDLDVTGAITDETTYAQVPVALRSGAVPADAAALAMVGVSAGDGVNASSISSFVAPSARLDTTDPLIEGFRGATVSAELFEFPNGVNEFDLLKIGSTYYFAQDDKTTTQLRSASSIAGLASATAHAPVATLRYPTIYYDADTTTWHLWGNNVTSGVAEHYTSSTFTGTYTLSDSLAAGYGDLSVRKLSDGNFYLAYKDTNVSPASIGTMVADNPAGPWANRGYCFADIDRPPLAAGEQADPDIWEADGKTYLTFSAWDGQSSSAGQRPSIVRMNRDTGRVIGAPVVLVNALQSWQQANGQSKLFNAVFLREDANPDRIYYSQNVSTSGVSAGWGYLEIGDPPGDGRTDGDLINVDFRAAAFDRASGVPPVVHGSGTVSSSGLTTTSSTGGAYGFTNLADVADFTLTIDFTPGALPASGQFACLTLIGTITEADPIIGFWLENTAGTTNLHCEIHNASSVGSVNLLGTTVIAAGTRYVAVAMRRGNQIYVYLNGSLELQSAFYGSQTGLSQWVLANKLGFEHVASQQFQGTIKTLRLKTQPAALVAESVRVEVVDSGSNTDGTWRRLSDGTMECWNTVSLTVAANSSHTDSATLSWPQAFKAAPDIQVTASTGYSNTFGFGAATSVGATTYVARAINIQGTPSNTAGTCTVNVYAKGTWL